MRLNRAVYSVESEEYVEWCVDHANWSVASEEWSVE